MLRYTPAAGRCSLMNILSISTHSCGYAAGQEGDVRDIVNYPYLSKPKALFRSPQLYSSPLVVATRALWVIYLHPSRWERGPSSRKDLS